MAMGSKPEETLSRRERQIMDIVYARGEATAADVAGRVARPADEDGGPHAAADPRGEGAPDAPAGRADVRVSGEPAAGPRGAVRAAAGLADVLRRLAREGGRRPPRRRGDRAVTGRAEPARGPHRSGQEERGNDDVGVDRSFADARGSEWLGSLLVASSAKSAVVLAAAALAALALRRGSAAARHLVWTVAVAGSLCLPVLSARPAGLAGLRSRRPGPGLRSSRGPGRGSRPGPDPSRVGAREIAHRSPRPRSGRPMRRPVNRRRARSS